MPTSRSEPSSSIRFRVIKKYVGLFEVARIWVALPPVALKALLAFAKVRWNLQGHITVMSRLCAYSESHSWDIKKYAPSKAASSKLRTELPDSPAASLRRMDTRSPSFHRSPAI
jgi:hypothetical protein